IPREPALGESARAETSRPKRDRLLTLLLTVGGFWQSSLGSERCASAACGMAPEEGLEPSTPRLTAACSTIELLWIPKWTRNVLNRSFSRQRICPSTPLPASVESPRCPYGLCPTKSF